MKLIYRGISYQHTPPAIDILEIEGFGKYRGVSGKSFQQKYFTIPTSKECLKYRGVAYGLWN